MDRKNIGMDAEQRAEEWLCNQGLILLKRNARCRLGEIDLIMYDRDTIVFIEVRRRKHSQFGGAAASVDWQKQRKLIRTARYIMSGQTGWDGYPCRFDVVAFEGNQTPIWYKDAFRP